MPEKYHALRSVLIAALLPAAFAGKMDSAGPALTEQTLEAIRDCMAQSPAPWSEEWKRQYLETIRSEVELHRDASHYALRLEILREGFAPCWGGLRKTKDRPLFEVYRCRTRWYVEHLMGTEFPSEDERQRLRDQFTDIWDHAASSLLTQFPFLDPNTVNMAKADDLSPCYRKIDAPLMPIYLRTLSEEQVGQIKQRWGNLRYARVDLWRQLGGGSTTPSEDRDAPSSSAEHDYQLTKKSLSQLLAQIWMVVPQRPDYYLNALENRTKALERRLQSKRQARSDQQRLEKTSSRQLLQTEHISFLLAALLETPQRSKSIMKRDKLTVHTPLLFVFFICIVGMLGLTACRPRGMSKARASTRNDHRPSRATGPDLSNKTVPSSRGSVWQGRRGVFYFSLPPP